MSESAPSPTIPITGEAPETTPKDSLTVKMPAFLRAALDREAAKWGQSAPEFIRSFIIFAMRQEEGVTLKLHAAAMETTGELTLNA